MANNYFKAILVFAFIMGSNIMFSQVDPDPPGAPVPPGVPIDGGVIGLLVLGTGYAIKKIHANSVAVFVLEDH